MAGISITTTRGAIGLLLLLFSSSGCCLPVAALFFNYSSFGQQDYTDIKFESDAHINTSAGWIEVTGSGNFRISDSRGRASYNARPVLLWDKVTGEVASFATRFAFAIWPQGDYGGRNNKGAGMAFFLAAYPSSLPPGSAAYDLSLTNQDPAAVAAGDARFVAVEFDTFNDTAALDPDATYDHLGIDVNSVRSVATATLPSFTLQGNMTAEVRFDNLTGVLEVELWLDDDASTAGPSNYSLSHVVDLKNALPAEVAVGFSASTSTSVELHQVRSWYFSSTLEPKAAAPPPPTPPPAGPGRGGGVIAGAAVGAALAVALLLAMAALLVRRRRRRSKGSNLAQQLGEVGESPGDDDGDEPIMEIEKGTGPRRFPYHELVAATRSFAPEEKLGQGGFGSVYRGYLREPAGVAVAIKRFVKGSSMQGRKEYTSEIKVISRLRHRNLVQLVGWSHHGRDELLLVYELVPNRSLDVHLHGGGGGAFLTWPVRVKIMLGLGSALLYLHEEWEQCVVHRDVKPSNVMLDEAFNAKLGDFGLARFIDHAAGAQTMTDVSGTPGYVDPESLITGRASAESDVYSFGVVVLELTCGRRPMSLLRDGGGGQKNAAVFRLVEWAWDLHGRGSALAAADERLAGEYDAAEVERAVAVGLWCAHPDPRARPTIRAAMAALQSSDGGPLPALPPKMPVPTYAAPVATPAGLFSYTAASGVTASNLTQSSLTQTSGSSDTTSGSTGSKDSSSLLKHQY